jgi:DNA-binding SARP family transcriptional activator
MSTLRFEVLGPVRGWHDETELDLGSPQQRAVLAVLLLSQGWQVSIDGLVDALWGQDPPAAAHGTVRTYISRLRRGLGQATGQQVQDLIKSVGDGYALVPDLVAVDLDLFTQQVHDAQQARRDGDPALAARLLGQALDLWRGLPLAGIGGPYADAQRARLAELRMAATEERLALAIESGGHRAAAAELRMLVGQYPLREKLAELLMLALYRSGRQADALAAFAGTRRLLRDELGLDPGPGLRELHERILRADRDLTAVNQPAASPPPAPSPRPAASQLPPGLADFTGRSEALDGIAAALRASTTPVIAITGMPGIGKTTLALRAAHAALGAFPDGQLYAEAGRGDQVGQLMTAEPAGRRMLVVLDDAWDAAQVCRLRPALAGCAVIITTQRRMIDLPGVHWFEIGRLTAEEGRDLLEGLIGVDRVAAEPAAARLLLTVCAGQPLAVRTAAARLAARPSWRISAMVRALQEELTQPMATHPDCALVEAPFERAHRRLEPDQAFLFRQAALADGLDVSISSAAALAGLGEHKTMALLDALADVHLLEPGDYGHYRYDPLVKVYARRQALIEDRLHRAGTVTALVSVAR